MENKTAEVLERILKELSEIRYLISEIKRLS